MDDAGRTPATEAGTTATVAGRPSGPAPGTSGSRGSFLRTMWGRVLIATVLALIIQSLLTFCLVQSNHLLEPHNMPFGQTASSPVTKAVQSKLSLTVSNYSDESAAIEAMDQGKIYGAYVPGASSDTLYVVPAKSFFAFVILEGSYEKAAHELSRPLVVKTEKPLPFSDRTGGVTGLLNLPLLIGGLLLAIFAMKVSGRSAARWRVGLLVAYCALGALLTDLIAGPGIGAYASDRFWPLYPCFLLIMLAIALPTAALQRLAGQAGTIIVVIAFIVLGLSSSGGGGLSLLPTFWQTLGTALPPQHAITLIRNILYFGGNNITVPLLVLGAYVLIGAVVVSYYGWFREARTLAKVDKTDRSALSEARRKSVRAVVGVVVIVGIMQCLFSTTYMASGHSPVADRIPMGVVGTSPLVAQVQKDGYSLDVHEYSSVSAAVDAAQGALLFGVLIPGTGTAASYLHVIPTQSDLAPLDLADQFERAAKTLGLTLKVKAYAPTPLPSGDPYGIVLSIMLAPLLIGGYFVSTLLTGQTGTSTGRWRVSVLAGFAILGALFVNLIVCYGLNGYPSGKFWVAWPICALIIVSVSALASVLQKLIGALGTLLTIILVILLGNPSSGGANGVPYLPRFWQDIGPYLPPRNAYLLLRNAVYFSGHDITQSLVVLVLYAVVFGAASSLLGWFKTPQLPIAPETEVDAAAVTAAAAGSF